MKKLLAICAILVITCTACSTTKVEHTQYTAFGRYYTDGTVITDDGNIWGYDTDSISERAVYDNMPVWVGFDDNGTPNDITDDIILGLVWDKYTAIYDKLETSLSESFTIEREGNNLTISRRNE